MITWTLLYTVLWFVFGIFFGFRRAFKAMFWDCEPSRRSHEFGITISPMFIVYLVGLGAFAVS